MQRSQDNVLCANDVLKMRLCLCVDRMERNGEDVGEKMSLHLLEFLNSEGWLARS
jgi:hypothetical protein